MPQKTDSVNHKALFVYSPAGDEDVELLNLISQPMIHERWRQAHPRVNPIPAADYEERSQRAIDVRV